MTPNIKTLKQEIANISKDIDQQLKNLLSSQQNSTLVQAAKFSSITPESKKIRPFLTVQTAKIFNMDSQNSVLPAAAALEMIHTYSLIHDDLPAIDDDDFRRGQPSCHKKFSESTAILTGNALLIFAFEILSTIPSLSSDVKCKITLKLTQILGFNGMIYGQMLDIAAAKKVIPLTELEKIHSLKTAKFMSIACEVGALMGNATNEELKYVEIFGNHLGMIFQITDDLLDQDTKQQDECNITNMLNKKEIDVLLDKHTDQALVALDQMPTRDTNILKTLLFFLKDRTT